MAAAQQLMINVGLAGLGFMAAMHIKAYQKTSGIRVAALCNPSGRHLNGDFSDVSGNVGTNDPVKLDLSAVKTYRDYADLLADPSIDLIDICAPTLTHHTLAVAALQAGKHVLCEKPLARTSKMAREIAAAAKKAKGFCMPAMCLRFLPEWAWLKNAIDANQFGKVLSASFQRIAEPPGWGHKHFFDGQKSGGALLDLHVHDVDFVQFCFGRPSKVYSTGYTKFSGAIDHVVTQYEVTSGAIVQAEGSWAMAGGFGFRMSYRVNFENATADYDLARPSDLLRLCEEGKPAQTVKCEGPDGYIGEISYLAECIRTGQAPKIVTVQDGLSSVEICEAEELSIQRRESVVLNGN